MIFPRRPRLPRRSFNLVVSLALALLLTLTVSGQQQAAVQAAPQFTLFQLFPANAAVQSCLSVPGQPAPSVQVVVARGDLNDVMQVQLQNFRPGVAFDLFTVQRSPQLADGSRNPAFTTFGLAWYQSDLQSDSGSSSVGTVLGGSVGSAGSLGSLGVVAASASGSTTVKTILLDQIFGFDPDVGLAPTNTFHLGFWFNDPQQAFDLGCEPGQTSPVVTPFNGEHHAGPLAFISRPDPSTGLGPLCTNPNTSTTPATCNP